MKTRYYIALFAASFTLIGIGFFPAERAFSLINKEYGTAIQISKPSGSIWCGRAQSITLQGKTFTNLSWHLSPFSLLFGNIKTTLTGTYQSQQQTLTFIRYSNSEYLIKDAHLLWNLDQLVLPLKPAGQLEGKLKNANYSNHRIIDVNGELQWKAAELAGELLGDYRITFKTENNKVMGLISSLKNTPVVASGQLTLHPEGQYFLDLTLKLTKDISPKLKRNLELFGHFNADNSLSLQQKGRLSELQSLKQAL